MKLIKAQFVLVVFSIFTIGYCVGNKCPSEYNVCQCSDEMIDCSNAKTKLTEMGDQIHGSQVRTLDLSNNSIAGTKALDAPFLTYLSLANNSLTTVEYDTFDNLDELKTLVLSYNNIRRITDDVFEWNPLKLEVLHLENNQIEFIQHFLLYDLEQLTELYLQNNNITFIHSHAFLQLKKLRIIHLHGNHLYMFDSKWFKGLKANMFEEITLQNNPWSCDCAMQPHSQWIKNKNTKWFRRLMKHEDLYCTQPLKFNNTRIRDFYTVKNARCDPPSITGISQDTTLHTGQSVQLDCVINKQSLPIPQLMWIAPNNDHYSLQTADRYEGIEVFQNGSLVIHNVNQTDNGTYFCIATAHNKSVQASMSLTVEEQKPKQKGGYVDVGNYSKPAGKVKEHDSSDCPAKCTCVALHVDCSPDDGQGELTEIPINEIPSNARSVSVASNNIREVAVFTKDYPHLTELRLDNNVIDNIQSKAFDSLVNLQTLTVRDNKLTKLPHRLFKNLKKLTILVLDNNMLSSIDHNTLYGLTSLQWLYIRHNLISDISGDAFKKLLNIKFIHLENNELPMLQKETVSVLVEKSAPTVQKIFVDFNLFNCDCNMEELRKYLRDLPPTGRNDYSALFGDGIKCNFPVGLHGNFLREIENPLICNNTNTPVTTIIKFKAEDQSGAFSGLWFAGLIVGFLLCIIALVVYKKYGAKKFRSMKYSNLPGYDDTEEHRSLNADGSTGTEAFV